MKWLRWVGVSIVGVVWLAVGVVDTCAANGDEEPGKAETVVIPLDQIWAYGMPGTRPMSAGMRKGAYVAVEGPLLSEICQYLDKWWRPKVKATRASFAVSGTEMEAMRHAHAVLVENEKPRTTFPAGSDISIVFFSHRSTWYTHLHSVEQTGNQITVRYRFVPHQTANLTEHFALIPLSKLDAREYHVSFVKLPMEQRLINIGWKPRPASALELVCNSFSFTIKENLKN